jgi:diadenosine tetraphosphatase ApaH/serine/threonine PP2A family protein phosphatase
MPIHSLLARNKVNILFHGHDHFFATRDLDRVVYQLVPRPSARKFDNTRSEQEYGYVHGDVLSAPCFIRIRILGL